MTQSPKSPVLEACAHCGGEADIATECENGKGWVFCKNCGTCSRIAQHIDHAIAYWNTRAKSPRQEALEEVAKDMAAALIRYPIFHRCAFPNAANFESCLTCATNKALKEYNTLKEATP